MDDEVYAAGLYDFCLIFCLGGALAVVAPFDFDFDGFALDGGGDIGGAFGHGWGDVFDWADLFAVAEDVGVGFSGVDYAAGDWDALGLATGEANEFDDGFGEFIFGPDLNCYH